MSEETAITTTTKPDGGDGNLSQIVPEVIERVGEKALDYIKRYGDVEVMIQLTKSRNGALGKLYYEYFKTGKNEKTIAKLLNESTFVNFYDTVSGARQLKGAFAYPVSYRECEVKRDHEPAKTLDDFLGAWESKRSELIEMRETSRGIEEQDLPEILGVFFTRSIAMNSALPQGEEWTRGFIEIVNDVANKYETRAEGTVLDTRRIFLKSLLQRPETLGLIRERALPFFVVLKAAGSRSTPEDIWNTSEFLDNRISDIDGILKGVLEEATNNNDNIVGDRIKKILGIDSEQEEIIDL